MAKKPELEIEYRPIIELKPYPRNARTHTMEQVNQLVASIREFGWTNPILIDEEDMVVAGHGRLLAAKKMKAKKVPTIRLCGLTDVQRRAYVIADNKLALNAGWNTDLLEMEFLELDVEGFELGLTGFDDAEIADFGSAPPALEDPEDQEQTPHTIFGGATAIHRASVPLRYWRENEYLVGDVLDFGAGHEDHEFAKYDAFTNPDIELLLRRWDVVMCNYVLQVQPAEHLVDQLCLVLRSLLRPGGKALIAIRNDVGTTTKSTRGTQLSKTQADWEGWLRRVFWIEPVDSKGFWGFVGTNPEGGEQ